VPLLDRVPASTPLGLTAVAAGAALVVRSLAVPAGAVLPLRGLRRLAGEVDVLGSLLAVVALGSLVWAFAAADPATEVVAHGAVLLPVAGLAAVAFVLRERRAAAPVLPLRALRPVGAWGALLVNLLVGGALVAALVDVPLFARATTTPGDQLGAALVLLRLLVAVPVGAVAGGWLCRTVAPRLVAAGGMALAALALLAMTGWGERSLDGGWSTVVLLGAGLGFGLAIAPVNAVLLGVTGPEVHGSAGALAVVARTVGMLVGLSLLTAVALRRFTAEVAAIGSPLQLCPRTPADCPAYDAATDAAVLTQLHTVFAGAALTAALAAVAALALLRTGSAAAR
jgi:MFS transporter, DHA2 family, triacylglyceride efflux pump